MSAESPAAKFLPLGEFSHQKAIKEGIFNEKYIRDSHIYLAKTEGEYTQLLSAASRKQCALTRERKTKESPLAAIARKFRNSAQTCLYQEFTHIYS
jgi:hypothetical protein